MKKMLLAIAFLILAGLLGCGGHEDERIIARVGKSTLTIQDVQKEIPRALRKEWHVQQAEALVQRWIESELVYQEALREGIDKAPEVQDIIRKQIKESVVAHYLEQKMGNSTAVAESEIDAYYADFSDEFLIGEDTYRLRIILLSSLAEANEVRQMIVAGNSFAEVAKRRSKDGSRGAGGDWGFVPLSRLSPMLSRAIPTLRSGEVSRPIKSELGYNLVLIEDFLRKGSTIPLDQVKDVIVQRIQVNKNEKRYRQLIEDLSREISLQTDLELLHSLTEKETQ